MLKPLVFFGWFLTMLAITVWASGSNSRIASIWMIIFIISVVGGAIGLIANEADWGIWSSYAFKLFTQVCFFIGFPGFVCAPWLLEETRRRSSKCPFS